MRVACTVFPFVGFFSLVDDSIASTVDDTAEEVVSCAKEDPYLIAERARLDPKRPLRAADHLLVSAH